MFKKMDVHNVALSTTIFQWNEAEGAGRIPDNLARLTETVLKMHKVNGDLAWVQDMAHDMEVAESGYYADANPHTLTLVANALSAGIDAGNDAPSVRKEFDMICQQISDLMGDEYLTEKVKCPEA